MINLSKEIQEWCNVAVEQKKIDTIMDINNSIDKLPFKKSKSVHWSISEILTYVNQNKEENKVTEDDLITWGIIYQLSSNDRIKG